jgi:hypothetical protein
MSIGADHAAPDAAARTWMAVGDSGLTGPASVRRDLAAAHTVLNLDGSDCVRDLRGSVTSMRND